MQIRAAVSADVSGIAKVKCEVWHPTYDGLVPPEALRDLDVSEQEAHFATILREPEANSFLFVAEEESGQIVGFVRGGPSRKDDPRYPGEIYALYVLPLCHKRGIGRALMQRAMQEFLRLGTRSVLLYTLWNNPARAFYENLGAQLLYSETMPFGKISLERVFYGWQDIAPLAE